MSAGKVCALVSVSRRTVVADERQLPTNGRAIRARVQEGRWRNRGGVNQPNQPARRFPAELRAGSVTSAGRSRGSDSTPDVPGSGGRTTAGLRRMAGRCTTRRIGSSQSTSGFHCGEVRRSFLGGLVEEGQAALDAAHVHLRLTQRGDERQLQSRGPGREGLGGAGARVEPHADRGDLAAAARHARQRHQLGVASGGRLAIERRIADGHEDDVGERGHARQVEAVQAARRIEDHEADARRRAQHPLRVDRPADDGRALRQRLFTAQAQPALGGLLTIHVAQHHRDAAVRIAGRQMGGQRALAAAALAVDDGDDRHGAGDWRTDEAGICVSIAAWPQRRGRGKRGRLPAQLLGLADR